MRFDVCLLVVCLFVLGYTAFAQDSFTVTETTVPKRPYRILLISSDNCPACVRLKAEINNKLRVKGWDTYIEQLEYGSSQEAKKYAIQREGMVSFPQTIVIRKSDNHVKAVLFGMWDGDDLGWALYGSTIPPR